VAKARITAHARAVVLAQFRLYTTQGWLDEHVAELVRRLRSLEATVEVVKLEPRREQPPAIPSGVTSSLGDGAGLVGPLPILCERQGDHEVVSARGRDAVAVLASISADVPAYAEPSDEALIDEVERLRSLARRAGFAHGRQEYVGAYEALFEGLDALEARLATRRYLLGGRDPSLADLWLFALLVRFETTYYGLYKCNRERIRDRPQLGDYLRDLFQRPGFADTVDWDAIKKVHYWEDARIGPKLRVPKGEPDLWGPHDRARRFDREELVATGVQERSNSVRARGEWVRGTSRQRDLVTADGSSDYPAEAGRYHLYVANNCPWCHRVALTRAVKGLTSVISLDVLYFRRHPELGWQFNPEEPGCTEDSLYGHRYIKELYDKVGSSETSVPILFDRVTETIVNNESAEIMRMLDQGFGALGSAEIELYPSEHAAEIDALNAWIYTDINNGAYKAGFTDSQAAYELAFDRLFSALERLDRRLEDRRFLCGARLTEADLRLFPTLFRFDHVYYTRFRLDKKRVRDHRHLHRWLRDVYHQPGVAEASNLEHCKRGYFGRNANEIVPLGPVWDFEPDPAGHPKG